MRPVPLLIALLALVLGLLFYFNSGSDAELEGLQGPGVEEGRNSNGEAGELQNLKVDESGDQRHSLEGTPAETDEGTTSQTVEAFLEEPTELRGMVVDPLGAPIEGCRVTFLLSGKGAFPRGEELSLPLSERPATTTDHEGRFSFRNLPSGERHGLLVHHPDIALLKVEGVLVAGFGVTEEPPIVLRRGKRVRGTVTTFSGVPIAGAALHLDSAWNAQDPQPTVDRLSTTTNAQGEYLLQGIPDGTRFLTARAEGFGTLTQIQSLKFSDETGDQHLVDFRLQGTARMAGRVVDTSGEPLEGVEVVAVDRSAYRQVPHGRDVTKADGSFDVLGLQAGTYQIHYWAPGSHEGVVNDIAIPQEKLELVLEHRITFSGVVVDRETGAGVSSFSLFLRTSDSGDGPSAVAQDGVDFARASGGAFALPVVQPRGNFLIEARAPGYAPTFSAPFTNPGGTAVEGLRIEMERGGSIRGRLVDDQGEPVAGGWIESRDQSWSDDPIIEVLGDYFPSESTVREVRSDRDGVFRLPHLHPGTYRVLAESARFHRIQVESVVVDEGEEVDLGDLVLTTGGRLRGRLFDADSKPVVGGSILLQSDRADEFYPIRRVKSGVDGHWHIDNIVPGDYALIGSPPTLAGESRFLAAAGADSVQRVSVVAGEEEVRDLRLPTWTVPVPKPPKPPTGSVNGNVVANGSGSVGLPLHLVPVVAGSRPTYMSKSEREGAFTFLAVLPGEYILSVEGFEGSERTLTVIVDEWTYQLIELE